MGEGTELIKYICTCGKVNFGESVPNPKSQNLKFSQNIPDLAERKSKIIFFLAMFFTYV